LFASLAGTIPPKRQGDGSVVFYNDLMPRLALTARLGISPPQGWTQLILAKPTLIYGLNLAGSLGSDTQFTVEYQSDGVWIPFTAATLNALPNNGRLDLSWDHVVAQTLRIRLSSSIYVSGYLSEVEVLGETATSILHRLQPEQITTNANTSPNAPVCFLSDGNTYTGWQLRGSATSGAAVFEFPTASTLNAVKFYFSSAFTGNLTLEAAINDTWEQIADVANQSAGWYRLDLSNNTLTTTKVRLIVSGCFGTDTVLREVEFWGYGDFGGATRQAISDQEAVAIAPSGNTANAAISDGGLKVLYSSANTTAITNSIQHNLKLYNTGSAALNLSDVKLRYWYTNETDQQQVANIYWSTVGSQNITTQFVTVANRTNADTYLELGFSATAGKLAPGSYVEIKLGLNASNWTSYNQADDFSFTSDTSYTENAQYTGYLNDTRAWGREADSNVDNSVNLQFTKPTFTIIGNQAADGRLKVLHQSANTATTTNSLQANLKFANTSGEILDLTKVKLRYWYTNDTQKTQTANIWASSGTANVAATFGTVASTSDTADTYLELGFSAGTLEPGATVEIKFGLNASDWSNYKQSNDYSFVSNSSAYAENTKVAGYIDDQLAWGIEPDTRPVFDNATYRLELSFTGTLTENAVVTVNNTELELQPALTVNDRTIYCGQLTADQLWNEVNYLRVEPFSAAVTLENAFITRHDPYGECTVALEGLSDGLLLTATTPTATEWQFGQPIAIEEATVTTTDNSGARLYAWVNETWTELSNFQSLDWGTRYTGPITTSKLKLEAGGTIGELILKGSVATNQAPTVQIFWPTSGEEISLQGWANQEVIGLVDNSKATVNVNNNKVTLDGHYFTFPLSKLTAANGETVTITATAQDLANRTGSASVSVIAGKYSEVTLDQADTLVYTAASNFTISGTVNNQSTQYQVNVAGTSVTISGNRFVTSVNLKEGLNLIKVQAIKNNQLVKTFYRRVVRNSETLALTIQTPENGAYFNTQSVTVTYRWLTMKAFLLVRHPNTPFRLLPVSDVNLFAHRFLLLERMYALKYRGYTPD
jgi:hypothetical protein